MNTSERYINVGSSWNRDSTRFWAPCVLLPVFWNSCKYQKKKKKVCGKTGKDLLWYYGKMRPREGDGAGPRRRTIWRGCVCPFGPDEYKHEQMSRNCAETAGETMVFGRTAGWCEAEKRRHDEAAAWKQMWDRFGPNVQQLGCWETITVNQGVLKGRE